MSPTLHTALDEARARLHALYGDRLVRLVLYGSHARGDATPDSDIDVLVVLRGEVNVLAELRRMTGIKLDLLERYDALFSFQPFDEAAYRDRARPLMRNVQAEGVEL